MSKGFDISAVIGSAVSNLDTTPGAISIIPAEQVHPNELNFYDVSNVDSLVDSILMDGLQSPIVVNRTAADSYTIISGHRRFASLKRIIEEKLEIREGKLFAADIMAGNIPCLVNTYDNPLQAELALIRANSDIRVLSSAETAQQIARVEMLLYQLKEQGYDFPGKMRDYVADACKVSASKIARLKVINSKLSEVWSEAYKSGKLNESAAYELAKLPDELQRRIKKAYTYDVSGMQTHTVTKYADAFKGMQAIECKHGESHCTNIEAMWSRYTEPNTYHSPCNRCCKGCYEMTNCKAVCPKFRDEVLERKREIRAENKKARDEAKARELADIERIKNYWMRFGVARRAAGVDLSECFDIWGVGHWANSQWYVDSWKDKEHGKAKFTASSETPYSHKELQSIVKLAQLFGCSVEYLLCMSDDPKPVSTAPAEGWIPMQYLPGIESPEKEGQPAVCKFDIGAERPLTEILYWRGGKWRFDSGAEIELPCVGWFPIPDDGGDVDEDA